MIACFLCTLHLHFYKTKTHFRQATFLKKKSLFLTFCHHIYINGQFGVSEKSRFCEGWIEPGVEDQPVLPTGACLPSGT